MALSLLFEIFGKDAFGVALERGFGFSGSELENLYRAWERGINSPLSSSVGRLFDAIASLLGIRQVINYEGQSAMLVEDLYDPSVKDGYPFELSEGKVDWRPFMKAILEEKNPVLACSRFINTLARIALVVAKEAGLEKVCLSGGVFQNNPLTTKVKELLTEEGFEVYTHRRVPPNDGGISLGQLMCSLTFYIK